MVIAVGATAMAVVAALAAATLVAAATAEAAAAATAEAAAAAVAMSLREIVFGSESGSSPMGIANHRCKVVPWLGYRQRRRLGSTFLPSGTQDNHC